MPAVSSLLTVVIAASPVPSHPSTALVSETLESLKNCGIDPLTRVIIAHDAMPPFRRDNDDRLAYEKYLAQLRIQLAGRPNIQVLCRSRWGHLNGNLRSAMQLVDTPFVLVVQHDFPFVRTIDIAALLSAMEQRSGIRHIKFSKRDHTASGWDANTSERLEYLQEIAVPTPSGEVRLVRTLGWSDNNHLCRAGYYRDIIFPIAGGLKLGPEEIIDPLVSAQTHDVFGTYIFGGLDDPRSIDHRDGRGLGLDKAPSLAGTPQRLAMRLRVKRGMRRRQLEFLGHARFKRWLRSHPRNSGRGAET